MFKFVFVTEIRKRTSPTTKKTKLGLNVQWHTERSGLFLSIVSNTDEIGSYNVRKLEHLSDR